MAVYTCNKEHSSECGSLRKESLQKERWKERGKVGRERERETEIESIYTYSPPSFRFLLLVCERLDFL